MLPTLTSRPVKAAPRLGRVRPRVKPVRRLTAFGHRRRNLLTVVGSLITATALVLLLAGRRDEFTAALSSVAVWVIVVTVLLQIIALVARSEAWHLTIEAAGGVVERRILYRASSMQVLGSVIDGQLGVFARIAALRRSSPDACPQVPTLVAAEFPILAVEAMLAALSAGGSTPAHTRLTRERSLVRTQPRPSKPPAKYRAQCADALSRSGRALPPKSGESVARGGIATASRAPGLSHIVKLKASVSMVEMVVSVAGRFSRVCRPLGFGVPARVARVGASTPLAGHSGGYRRGR
jgi:hypothetical protein